ncbi:MAG: sigma-54 dependent transcriptional regulator [PVC group bacterium]
MKAGSEQNRAGILVVEDDPETRSMLVTAARSYGYDVAEAGDGESARALLEKRKYDLVITDLVMPGVRGTELISFIRKTAPGSAVVVMTAHASVKIARECVKEGAAAFIVKPFTMEQMHYVAETALMGKKLMEEKETSYEDLILENSFFDLVGESVEMKKIYHTILTLAGTDSPVVICGETGTGKELVARAIHLNSDRREREMLVVDCATLSEPLLQSELFGHVKGAFTGAYKDREGLLKAGDQSTIFLDEISEISPQSQASLLRFLQGGEFRPVGGTGTQRSNARILAATNVNLEDRMAAGVFREDLYHRLNVLTVVLPPLRERREDIPLLSYYFLRNFARQQGKPVKNISSAAMSLLMAGQWPGNVRELENTIERAVTFCPADSILPCHLYPGSPPAGNGEEPSPVLNLNDALHHAEKSQILKALRMSKGNKQNAARMLGIDRITLWRKIKNYDLLIPPYS